MQKNTKHQPRKSIFSIKAKVALLCTCSIIIAVAFIFTYLINVCKEAITNSTEITMQELSASYSNNLSESVRQISESANFMMSSAAIFSFVDSAGTENVSEVEELVTMFLGANSSHEDISLVDKNGVVLFSSNGDLSGKNLSDEDYFNEMVSTGLSAQGNVFTSDRGDACITFAIPLRTNMQVVGFNPLGAMDGSEEGSQVDVLPQGGVPSTDIIPGAVNQLPVEEFTGAIITSVKVSEFTSMLSDINIADYTTGYSFIVDSNGTYLYHPDTELIGSKVEIDEINIIAANTLTTEEHSSEITTFKEDGVTKLAGYSVNEDNHWILFIAADESEILSILKSVTERSITVSILLAALLTLIAYLIAGTITKSIKRITQLIHKTAELDFTEDSSYEVLSKRNDETGEMSRGIHQMRSVLKEMIQHISDVSNRINESSDNLSTISNTVNNHVSDNSATAEELSASMEETAATTEQIFTTIEQIDKSSKEIADKVTLGANLSTEIIQRTEQLKSATELSTVIAKNIYAEVKNKTEAALEQSKAVQKISVLTKAIKDIASQTNLLALNASIEAARAGEAGSGFAVVASEIGSLAQQSSSTVRDISKIVDEVYLAVENMSKSMEQTLDFLEKNVLVNYNEFLDNSEKYNSDAKVMSITMEGIHQQINMLNTNLHGISDSISEINLMVGEASKGVNDVAEKNSNIVALTSTTQSLAGDNVGHANGLKEIVDNFQL